MGAAEEQPERAARDVGRGAQRDVGRRGRARERQEGAAGARAVPGRAPGQVPQVRHDAVQRRALLRAARLRKDAARQGDRQRVSGELHLDQGARAAHHVVRRVGGQRQGHLRQGLFIIAHS